jgi:hypothetical protein
MSERSERMKVASDALLADLVAFVEAQPCTCEPLFADQPDGAKFGPPCERCKLLDRYHDAVNDGTLVPANEKAEG